jgi:hypothetical protein
MFNVMQFFLYNSSINDLHSFYFLEQFLHIFNKVAPILLDSSENLKQYILGAAVDIKSDDILHTMISLFYVKRHLIHYYRKIDEAFLIKNLMATAIRR